MNISVIIPVYNASAFINRAVESALSQPETKEVILVEDASIDNSLNICQQIAAKNGKVKLLRHADGGNHGAGASRNLGIKKAKYDFIAFLDADDYYLPGRFVKDQKILQNNPRVEGVHNALGSHFYTNDVIRKAEFQKRSFTAMKEPVEGEDLFYYMSPIGGKGYFSLNTLTVRRSVFEKVGLFDPSLKVTQDTHFMVRLAAMCYLAAGNIREPVAIRSIHDSNRSTKKNVAKYRPLLFRSLYKWGTENNLPTDKLSILWKKYFRSWHKQYQNQNRFFLKLREMNFLVRELVLYPRLIKLRTYWNSYPILKRFI